MHKGSNFSTSSQTLVISWCFHSKHSYGYEVIPHCGFDSGDYLKLFIVTVFP